VDKITVLVADDHPVVRAGVRMLISAQPDMEVVGEAADGAECVERVAALRPHVVVLDLSMPRLAGLPALREIVEQHPDIRVLVLTMHEEPATARQVLDAGAAGFLVKRAVDVELIAAIRAVRRGEIFVHSALTGPLLAMARARAKGDAPHPAPHAEPLSPRELEVLGLLARGYTNQQVADRIFVSVKTVETYRARVLEKLGLRTRAELTRYALAHGLLSAEESPSP
jgi:two-component system, NarL family, response regulator NreC